MPPSYCAALAAEFKSLGAKSQLTLTGKELRDFATSPFFATTRDFYYYRRGAATYMSFVLFGSIVMCIMDMDGTIELYLIYYTRWSLLVLVAYLVLAAHLTRRYAQLRGELPWGAGQGGAAAAAPAPAPRTGAGGPVGAGQQIKYSSFATQSPLVEIDGGGSKTGSKIGSADSEAGGVRVTRHATFTGVPTDNEDEDEDDESDVIEAALAGVQDVAEVALLRSDTVTPGPLLRWTWVLQNVIFPNTLMVTLVFWLVIYPGVTFNHLTADDDMTRTDDDDDGGHLHRHHSYYYHRKHGDKDIVDDASSSSSSGGRDDDLSSLSSLSSAADSEGSHYDFWRMAIVTQEHGVNCAVMALDVFLSRAPYRMVAHAHHGASFAALFVTFSVAYYLCYGRNDSGKRYIYPQLDWATPLPTACFVAVGFAAGVPIVMWATWTVSYCGRRLGDWVTRRRRRFGKAAASTTTSSSSTSSSTGGRLGSGHSPDPAFPAARTRQVELVSGARSGERQPLQSR